MTTVADLHEHEDSCADCKPGRPCSRAEALFAEVRTALTARYEPPFRVIDYHAHERDCGRCKPWRPACSTGRALFAAAGEALAVATGRTVLA